MCNKIFVIFVPLITTPYITRVLGAEGLGIYTYCLSYSSLFIVLGTVGIPLYGKRTVAIYKDKPEILSKIFCELIFLQQLLLIVSCIAYYITAKCVGVYWWMFCACSVGHLAAFFDISWFYEGLEDFKTVVVRNFLIKILSVVCIFIFVKDEKDLYIYAMCLFSSNLLGNISLWKNISRYIQLGIPNIVNCIGHLKSCLFLLLPCAVTQLFQIIDKSMLGTLCADISEVAYYEQSRKIISLSMTLVTALGIVVMPRLSAFFHESKKQQLKEYINKAIDITLLVSVAVAFGCAAISSNLVPWFFGAEFEKVEKLLIISAPLIIFMGISELLGVQILTAMKKENALLIINVISIVINVFFNAILIPSYMSYGAMYATVLAEIVKCVILIVYTKELLDIREILTNLVKYILYAAIMYCFIVVLNDKFFGQANITNTICLVLAGIIVFGIILMVVKNQWMSYVIRKIIKK